MALGRVTPRHLVRQLRTLTTQQPKSLSSSPHTRKASTPPRPIDSRWLSLIKRRIGKCMTFGLPPEQIEVAGRILQQVARDWRELVAGSEGFLTGDRRRGLYKHNVIWGEMDVMRDGTILDNWKLASINTLYVLYLGHVNNVAYVRYAETSRINWTRNFAVYLDPSHKQEWLELMGSKGIGWILRSIKVDYKFPMTSPDKVSVYHKLSHPPHSPSSTRSPSSLHFDVIMLSESKQRPAARCDEDVVVYDYRIGQKVSALPQHMLDQFRQTWELQEEAKRANARRIEEIEAQVRALETGSWDREDAVEDTGSA